MKKETKYTEARRVKWVTIRRDPNKDGTISGTFFSDPGDTRFRYTAMYLPLMKTMSIVELRFQICSPKGKFFWKRLAGDHGALMRMALVRRLNQDLKPGQKLHALTKMPVARPTRTGG